MFLCSLVKGLKFPQWWKKATNVNRERKLNGKEWNRNIEKRKERSLYCNFGKILYCESKPSVLRRIAGKADNGSSNTDNPVRVYSLIEIEDYVVKY